MNPRHITLVSTTVLLIAALVGLYVSFFGSQLVDLSLAQASNSIAFGDGAITIEKKYQSFGSELDRIEITPSSEVTVRIKFNNTSTSTANNVSINDSIPSGFTYIPNSTTLKYVDADIVTINDSVWDNGTLTVAPEVGIHGNLNTVQSSDMSFGRVKYVNYYTCLYSNSVDDTWFDSYIHSTSNTPLSNIACRPLVGYTGTPAGLLNNSINSIDITSRAFLNMFTCGYANSGNGDIATQYYGISATNSAINSQTCPSRPNYNQATPHNPLNGINTLGSGGYALDLRSQSYINMFACTYDSNTSNDIFKDYFAINTSNTPQNSQTCRTLDGYTSTQNDPLSGINTAGTGGYAVDIRDTSRGYGYIEYKMIAPAAEGIHGTNVSMSGSFGNSIEDDGELTIATSTLACDYVTPTNGERTIDLQDAELRTDQDFTCNYNAEVCVELFMDLDEDGVFNNADYRIGGETINILRNNETTPFTSIQNTIAGTDCFGTLRNGIQYSINIPTPPTPISTTGGNTQIQDIFFESGTTTLQFGYSSGDLTLTTDETLSFGSFATSDTITQRCATVTSVTVSETRLGIPGYSITATISDFEYQNSSERITIAERLTSTPGSITVISGDPQDAPTIGIAKTATSTQDPLPIMSAGTGLGFGTYSADVQFCLNVPAYSLAGNLESIITFTAV